MRKALFTFIAITSGSAVFAQVPSVSEKGKADMLPAYVRICTGPGTCLFTRACGNAQRSSGKSGQHCHLNKFN